MPSSRFQSCLFQCLNFTTIFLLELVDFIWLVMEPYFKWLPLLGLLYVLVPYYNQFAEDEDCEEGDENCEEEFDPDPFDWDRK
ncbi:hypothetical protein TCAL_14502 [Tigriopus californicus]|uniref:Uncharacterized protein n=1 Tax=Tigriopus californicus TaxID=6832 RepID=A0A553PTB4_TIGCA|nr:hypothetical protein TCAL_14502 [Tigriopus californicus]